MGGSSGREGAAGRRKLGTQRRGTGQLGQGGAREGGGAHLAALLAAHARPLALVKRLARRGHRAAGEDAGARRVKPGRLRQQPGSARCKQAGWAGTHGVEQSTGGGGVQESYQSGLGSHVHILLVGLGHPKNLLPVARVQHREGLQGRAGGCECGAAGCRGDVQPGGGACKGARRARASAASARPAPARSRPVAHLAGHGVDPLAADEELRGARGKGRGGAKGRQAATGGAAARRGGKKSDGDSGAAAIGAGRRPAPAAPHKRLGSGKPAAQKHMSKRADLRHSQSALIAPHPPPGGLQPHLVGQVGQQRVNRGAGLHGPRGGRNLDTAGGGRRCGAFVGVGTGNREDRRRQRAARAASDPSQALALLTQWRRRPWCF